MGKGVGCKKEGNAEGVPQLERDVGKDNTNPEGFVRRASEKREEARSRESVGGGFSLRAVGFRLRGPLRRVYNRLSTGVELVAATGNPQRDISRPGGLRA